MATQKPNHQHIQFDQLIDSVVGRLRWQRTDLVWSTELDAISGQGDPEQWTVALENLLDNQIRYARSQIRIRLQQISIPANPTGRSEAVISIWNDGPPLDDKTAASIFQPFRKGTEGQFGLGLTIVQRIVALHSAEVEAENADGGVRFRIRIPL